MTTLTATRPGENVVDDSDVGNNLADTMDYEDNTTTNVIIMSEAGKPIFARYGTEEEINKQCGLIQALRTAINSNTNLGLGEIQSLQSNQLCIVFMTVGSITLMSISKISSSSIDCDNTIVETEAYCKLQLEYIYGQLIFVLTDQIQNIYKHNPSYDLRSIIMDSANDKLLHGILDSTTVTSGNNNNNNSNEQSNKKIGPFLVSAVQTIFPISHRIRQKASKVLQSIGGKLENNIAFALLVVDDKLLSVVQPSYRQYQLRISDLHLVLNLINVKQTDVISTSTELWIPICLPRFHSSGFLFTYVKCLDVESKLTLLLISSHGTTEQFQLLRQTSQQIQHELNIPQSTLDNNTIIVDNEKDDIVGPTTTTMGSDIGWKRTAHNESTSFDSTTTDDDDYVNISTEMINNSSTHSRSFVEYDGCELLSEIRKAQQLSTFENIRKPYLDNEEEEEDSLLLHFLFRLVVPIHKSRSSHSRHHQNQSRHSSTGHLSQCICPSTESSFLTSQYEKRKLWTIYQKLHLRLRLGSATVESTMDAFDMINNSCYGDDKDDVDNEIKNTSNKTGPSSPASFIGIGKNCPAIGLSESPPYTTDGLTYVVDNDIIYLAMNGKDFELYMATPNNISVKRAAAIGTKLVRGLISDEKNLFLTKPLTWRE